MFLNVYEKRKSNLKEKVQLKKPSGKLPGTNLMKQACSHCAFLGCLQIPDLFKNSKTVSGTVTSFFSNKGYHDYKRS